MQLDDERLDLLVDCLAAAKDVARVGPLRMALLGDTAAMTGMLNAALRRQLLGNVLDVFEKQGVVPLPPPGAGGDQSMLHSLAQARDDLSDRRAALSRGLFDMVGALNERDIKPLIVKGAVSLWTGEPAWRFQRDIDFRVAANEVGATLEALRGVGFEAVEGLKATGHHLQPLSRDDMPAVVEVHTGLCGVRSERVLPDRELVAGAVEETRNGLSVMRLSPHHFVLHGLVHHHVENFGADCGTISLKGLVEFAHALEKLDKDAAANVAGRANRTPRMAAALDLWAAATEGLLCQQLPSALKPTAQGRRRFAAIEARLLDTRRPSFRDALSEELRSCRAVTGSALAALPACVTALANTLQVLSWRRLDRRARLASGIIATLE